MNVQMLRRDSNVKFETTVSDLVAFQRGVDHFTLVALYADIILSTLSSWRFMRPRWCFARGPQTKSQEPVVLDGPEAARRVTIPGSRTSECKSMTVVDNAKGLRIQCEEPLMRDTTWPAKVGERLATCESKLRKHENATSLLQSITANSWLLDLAIIWLDGR
jgi:hypothetical protein